MKLIKSALLIAFSLLIQQAWACSCVPPPSVEESFKSTDAVFTGTVMKIEQEFDTTVNDHGDTIVLFGQVKTVTIKLDTDYKSTNTKKGAIITIKTASNSAACGYYFQKGKKYIVYAYTNKEDGMLSTNLCTRTKQYDEQEAAELERLAKK